MPQASTPPVIRAYPGTPKIRMKKAHCSPTPGIATTASNTNNSNLCTRLRSAFLPAALASGNALGVTVPLVYRSTAFRFTPCHSS